MENDWLPDRKRVRSLREWRYYGDWYSDTKICGCHVDADCMCFEGVENEEPDSPRARLLAQIRRFETAMYASRRRWDARQHERYKWPETRALVCEGFRNLFSNPL